MKKEYGSLEMDIKKEKYVQVEMEIIAFENEDVITASGDIETPEIPLP